MAQLVICELRSSYEFLSAGQKILVDRKHPSKPNEIAVLVTPKGLCLDRFDRTTDLARMEIYGRLVAVLPIST